MGNNKEGPLDLQPPTAPEDADDHEGRGVLTGRICSAQSSRSPCHFTTTRCHVANVTMHGKD
jgi:hypothetical protein